MVNFLSVKVHRNNITVAKINNFNAYRTKRNSCHLFNQFCTQLNYLMFLKFNRYIISSIYCEIYRKKMDNLQFCITMYDI